MTREQELLLKKLVREHECPLCLKQMMDEYPKMLDCIFRHNNDEHECERAEKYMEGIGMRMPVYKIIKIQCERCGRKSRFQIDINDGTEKLAEQLLVDGFTYDRIEMTNSIRCPQCRRYRLSKWEIAERLKAFSEYLMEVAE